MIKLTKDGKTLTVPTSAAKQYEANGWERADKPPIAPAPPVKAAEIPDDTADGEEIPDEKAIDAMSVEQLRALADKHDIDLSDCNFKREIKTKIKENLL